MLRSKKVSIIAILAIFASFASLVSSVVALSATLDNGVSSVVSVNNAKLAEPLFSVSLEFCGDAWTSKESLFLHKNVEIEENTLAFGVTYTEKSGVLTIPFSIVNDGELDGILNRVEVLGVPEHFTYKLEGIKEGDKITKQSKIDVLFSLEYGSTEETILLEPEVYDSLQIVLDLQK